MNHAELQRRLSHSEVMAEAFLEERERYKQERDELLLKMAEELDEDAKQERSAEPLCESDGGRGKALGDSLGR
jgi:hypothetical protein